MIRGGLGVVLFLVALAALGCGDDLPEGVFTSTQVSSRNGPSFEWQAVRVEFSEEDGQDVVSWSADCNGGNATVSLDDDRLQTGGAVFANSLKGCIPRVREEQDAWLQRFFDDDPLIEEDGDRISLSGARGEIELRSEG